MYEYVDENARLIIQDCIKRLIKLGREQIRQDTVDVFHQQVVAKSLENDDNNDLNKLKEDITDAESLG